jgi:hypothetical protein
MRPGEERVGISPVRAVGRTFPAKFGHAGNHE